MEKAIKAGYAPDALLQMDAETLFSFSPEFESSDRPPLGVLFDTLKETEGLVAVGAKERPKIIDPETGKPQEGLLPILQEVFTKVASKTPDGENVLYLPGGALLAEPDYYVAGMKAITEVITGDCAEDYLFTQMLKNYSRTRDNSIKIHQLQDVTFLDRCPQGKAAVDQALRWKRQGAAIITIFPDEDIHDNRVWSTIKLYTPTAVATRLNQARHPNKEYLRQLGEDTKNLPGIAKLIFDRRTADVLGGKASWEHK